MQEYDDFIEMCQRTFTPFAPIESPEFFFGRLTEIARIKQELKSAGRQLAIYGDRGIGKSSLAKVTPFFCKLDEANCYIARCTHESNYERIFGEILRRAGKRTLLDAIQSVTSSESGISKVVNTKKKSEQQHSFKSIPEVNSLSPGLILEQFEDENGLIIIDEFDVVEDTRTHRLLAETLKQFSDSRCPTRIIVVGVADSIDELFKAHSSISRCVGSIKLERMSQTSLYEIMTKGEETLGVRFVNPLKEHITLLADGFAHFVHLLCFHSVAAALDNWIESNEGMPKNTLTIHHKHFRIGIERAIKNSELKLVEQYKKAVIPLKKKTETFQFVTWAMGMSEENEVNIAEIAKHMSHLAGVNIKKQKFSYHLGKLTKDERGSILRKVRQGYYRFTDPLMRGFVRLQLERHNLIERDGQLEFPFMQSDKFSTKSGWARIKG